MLVSLRLFGWDLESCQFILSPLDSIVVIAMTSHNVAHRDPPPPFLGARKYVPHPPLPATMS